MIGCDNVSCDLEWFHFKCVGIVRKPRGKWYCPNCRGNQSNHPKSDKENNHDVEFTGTGPAITRQFEFCPVSEKWKVEKSSALSLPYHQRQGYQGLPKQKNVFDSPPKETQRVRGDGNCLFRALSHVITNSEEYHGQLRKLICDQIQKQDRRYLPNGNVADYLSRMKLRSVWGSDIEMSAAADLLGTVVWCYGPQVDKYVWISFKPQKQTSDEAVFLVNRRHHIEPLYDWSD